MTAALDGIGLRALERHEGNRGPPDARPHTRRAASPTAKAPEELKSAEMHQALHDIQQFRDQRQKNSGFENLSALAPVVQ